MDNDSQFIKFTSLLKYFTPILIAILYFQGYAFHAGRIESYMINESLYPLSHEQVFIQTYFFYVNLISHFDYIFYTIVLLFLVMLLTSIADNKNNEDNKAKNGITNKILIKVIEFLKKHKKAFLVPVFLVALIYAAIILILISIIPYHIGKIEGAKRLEILRNLERYDELVVKSEKTVSVLYATIIESSDKFVTVLTKDNKIKTIPFSEITSIIYRQKKHTRPKVTIPTRAQTMTGQKTPGRSSAAPLNY